MGAGRLRGVGWKWVATSALTITLAGCAAGLGAVPFFTSFVTVLGAFALTLVLAGCTERLLISGTSDIAEPGADGDSDSDTDADGVPNALDNCPLVDNPDQVDSDGDGYGDACDLGPLPTPCCGPECELDSDGDRIPDVSDLCPWTVNSNDTNVDSDYDGLGDACDYVTDHDGDGLADIDDNCPLVFNPDQANSDSDGGEPDLFGDACDICDYPDYLSPCGEFCCYDADGDLHAGGILYPSACSPAPGDDNCPWIANPEQQDDDNDGVGNPCDNCPDEPNPYQQDVNGDGVGDACKDTVGALSKPSEQVRLAMLGDFLARDVISLSQFFDFHGGSMNAARVAARSALRARFVADGTLAHGIG